MTDQPYTTDTFEAVDLKAPPVPVRKDALAQAHFALVNELARIAVPHGFDAFPMPEQFEDVADYLVRLAQAFDRFLLLVGQEAQSNASVKMNMAMFTNRFASDLEGNTTFELDRAAADIRESDAEYRTARRDGRTASAIINTIRNARGL